MREYKINELKVGEIYTIADDNIYAGVKYKIDENGILYCYNKIYGEYEKASMSYNYAISHKFKIKEDIDWSKIPQGTKVQVLTHGEWHNAYFYTFNENQVGVTEWDEDNEFTGYYRRNWVQWHYANDVRLYEEKEIEIY